MTFYSQSGSIIVVCGLLYLIRKLSTVGSRPRGLPPGPPTAPLIGNALAFPSVRPHLQFTTWAKQYGDVFSLTIVHKTIIVLNTPSAVREIIDKRSNSSSNRPKSVVLNSIVSPGTNFGMSEVADETWRLGRKAAAHLLSPTNFKKFRPIQHAEATQLIWDLMRDPNDWFEHIGRYTTSFALAIIYGHRAPNLVSTDVVEFLNLHPQLMKTLDFNRVAIVDLFPILAIIPWVSWKKTINDLRTLYNNFYGRLYTTVHSRLKKSEGNGAFMEQAIIHSSEWGLKNEEVVKNLGAVLLQGSDTTSATLQNLVICLVLFPEAQEKAHQEVMRVVGPDKAPCWEDLPSLPYTMALVQECNRFHPVDPLGLPHAMTEDEVVDGILYPTGTTILLNVWAILHDERYYDRPYEFIPERFIRHPLGVMPDVEDDPARRPNTTLFGGGRRVCPGIEFAQTSLDIVAANFVWGLRFSPAIDPSTVQPILPSFDDYSTGVTSVPKPVKITIQPRSSNACEVTQRQLLDCRDIFAMFEHELF